MQQYQGVNVRFLRPDERLIQSDEKEMPLVLEAKDRKDIGFLKEFLSAHSEQIIADAAQYGAVLFRGFDIQSDQDFEQSVLSIQGLRGISEAFMSEHGRTHVGDLKYVLHTNSIYKTGGTLYLGGFHTENYYNPDVPGYISFCCQKPSTTGGETGLINMEKVYQHLSPQLQQKLERNTYFVAKWLVSDVAERYQTSPERIEEICRQFHLPVIGKGKNKLILMYKPSVFVHPITAKKALQINLFELPTLNKALRQEFMQDYAGSTWFWHRFIWRIPQGLFKIIENIYVFFASLFHSPSETMQIAMSHLKTFKASYLQPGLPDFNQTKVGSCFDKNDVKALAKLMRSYYCSCLWKKGDIMFVDNRKVAHAGMPGAGPRTIRAMISNPISMGYAFAEPGYLNCEYRNSESIGYYIAVTADTPSV